MSFLSGSTHPRTLRFLRRLRLVHPGVRLAATFGLLFGPFTSPQGPGIELRFRMDGWRHEFAVEEQVSMRTDAAMCFKIGEKEWLSLNPSYLFDRRYNPTAGNGDTTTIGTPRRAQLTFTCRY